MGKFVFEETDIKGLKVITPFIARDNRGFFSKRFEREEFEANGIEVDIYECMESFSVRGVLRGLHFQKKESQAKLLHTIVGEIFDVVVDLRENSATYGKWKGFYLSGENKKSIYIPRGFAHGYLTVSDMAIVGYYADNRFASEYDGGILWDDPDIGIDWPLEKVDNKIVISPKDELLETFKSFYENVRYVE
ncbi:dTDP-4-dehydrorhamnose 3,5-epimerase [Bacilliculturomica massiliensis]|uniref:dTDP-4-dehydrorhamnose 3,5-epimerase n=1 Tax=Bacilliculturomica massiliensis TaxID=1917867 RepID=UPI001030D0AF|nr:dTDP-4-dehydrorhamnose 3,5-epimerase [Bacilliculturomica massiliensis]